MRICILFIYFRHNSITKLATMIEWINITFGIKNEVSVPILVSLIVFIVGGITSHFFRTISSYYDRKRQRKTFIFLIKEVISDLEVKEKHTLKFYPTIKVNHKGNWNLPFKTIGYLPTFFELDFNSVYFSYRKKIFWSCKPNLKNKAFHTTWSVLRNLAFIESKLEEDLEKMVTRFDVFHKEYGNKLEEYRKFHDDITRKINGVKFPASEKQAYDYYMTLDKIWVDWQKGDEKERTRFFVTYNHLIKPALDLNRNNPQVDVTQESNNHLLACTHQYIEMENTLKIYQATFKNYYENYRASRRLFKKCLDIISK